MIKPPTRRWILKGIGGATLAIPALHSLLPRREAEAAALATASNRIFIAIMSHFGGSWGTNMFPTMAANADTMSYAGKMIRRQPLLAPVGGGVTKISEVLQAPSSVLTPALAQKITLLQGLDMPFFMNHHTSVTLGNCASGDQPFPIGDNIRANPRPTIDQVIAWSPSFYKDLTNVSQRSVSYSAFGDLSCKYNKPGDRSSGVTSIPCQEEPAALLNSMFGTSKMAPSPSAPVRPSIVDLVQEDYTRLRNNSRLSKADLTRLDEQIARIADIQRRQSVTVTCTRPSSPPDVNSNPCGSGLQSTIDTYLAFQDVLVAGLACGLTQVVSSLHQGWDTTFGELCGDDWHQTITHHVPEDGPQGSMNAAMRAQFGQVIVPLAAKLDAVKDSSGSSLLDRATILWTHEHGTFSHAPENIPAILFGSAAGAIKTGQHIDYRDMNHQLLPDEYGADIPQAVTRIGLTYHQLFGSILQLYGIPKTEWNEPNHGGYGYRPPIIDSRQNHWGDVVWNAAGDILPYLAA